MNSAMANPQLHTRCFQLVKMLYEAKNGVLKNTYLLLAHTLAGEPEVVYVKDLYHISIL
jgi:hypothetical protein